MAKSIGNVSEIAEKIKRGGTLLTSTCFMFSIIHESVMHGVPIKCRLEIVGDKCTLSPWEIINPEMDANKAELLAEEIECLHLSLDKAGVPRGDESGLAYSLWGRVMRFKAS